MKQKKEYDDSWLWTADEIVKYAPENYDERGIYRKNEWLMVSDIGKVYDGKRFTREEYLETEDKYAQAVIRVIAVPLRKRHPRVRIGLCGAGGRLL